MRLRQARFERRTSMRMIVIGVFIALGHGSSVWSGGTVLLIKGLGNQTYLPGDALKGPDLSFKESYLAKIQTGAVLDHPFPKKLEALKEVRVIVLADIPASALNGLMGRRTLRQFVERGGGLLVFGGPFGYGKGEIEGSAFEAALPVATTGPWDLVKANSTAVKVTRASPITDGLRWNERPVLCYYHRVTAKPGSEALLECDGSPVLVTGQYGKGRVASFAGTYLGAPAEGETFFYQWSDYALLLSRLMRWLMNG